MDSPMISPPGLVKPKRLGLVWDLLSCALNGHEIVGTDVAQVRRSDALVVREADGLRWCRCLRCDSWLPVPIPTQPTRDVLPPREEIPVPLRGRPLRDRFVLRLIAVDRFVHFLLIGILAVAVLLFAYERERLRADWTRIVNALQGAVGGPVSSTRHGLLHDLNELFTVSSGRLVLYGVLLAGYALLNLVEAVGLWQGRRWAEYLAVIEVAVFLPIEIHELTVRVSTLKILALIVNLAIVAYLLVAHRLFGIRGGGRAYEAERERDTGWPALERTTPLPLLPAASPAP